MRRLTIAICGRKGGVGKTTLAVALTAMEVARGRRVLAVDLDPQGNFPMGLGTPLGAPGTAALLRGAGPAPQAVGKNGHLRVLPGGPDLENLRALDRKALQAALPAYEADTVIIDCPPGHRAFEDLAVAPADRVLICADPSAWAVVGAMRVLADQKDVKKGRRWAIIVSRWNDRRLIDRAVWEQLGGGAVPVLPVRQDAALVSAIQSAALLNTNLDKLRSIEDLRKIVDWCHETK